MIISVIFITLFEKNYSLLSFFILRIFFNYHNIIPQKESENVVFFNKIIQRHFFCLLRTITNNVNK